MLRDAPLALGFGAGMLAAFNPCGFAMLPAYMSWFLGLEAGEEAQDVGVLRSLAVGASVALGFVAVFAAAGLIVRQISSAFGEWFPWMTMAVGLVLIPIGIARLVGKDIKLRVPRWQRGPRDRGLRSMVLFGVSYATVSLSCTIGPFLTAVAGTFSQSSFVSGLAVFGAYAAGMAVVLMALTLALGLAKDSMVRHLRRVLPHVGRISGALLIVAGAYVAYYGWYANAITNGRDAPAGPVTWVERTSNEVSSFVNRVGETRLGFILAGLLITVLAVTLARRRVSAG